MKFKRDPEKLYKMVTGPNGKGVYVELTPKEKAEFLSRTKAVKPLHVETDVERLEKRIAQLEALISKR